MKKKNFIIFIIFFLIIISFSNIVFADDYGDNPEARSPMGPYPLEDSGDKPEARSPTGPYPLEDSGDKPEARSPTGPYPLEDSGDKPEEGSSTGSNPIEDLINSMGNSIEHVSDPTTDSAFMYLLSRIFTLLQYIGTGISIIIVTKLGITYMISSIEEKAKIKEKAVPIVIGSVLIVATVNIMKFIQVLVENSL